MKYCLLLESTYSITNQNQAILEIPISQMTLHNGG